MSFKSVRMAQAALTELAQSLKKKLRELCLSVDILNATV